MAFAIEETLVAEVRVVKVDVALALEVDCVPVAGLTVL
jgi:hypothetical protein